MHLGAFNHVLRAPVLSWALLQESNALCQAPSMTQCSINYHCTRQTLKQEYFWIETTLFKHDNVLRWMPQTEQRGGVKPFPFPHISCTLCCYSSVGRRASVVLSRMRRRKKKVTSLFPINFSSSLIKICLCAEVHQDLFSTYSQPEHEVEVRYCRNHVLALYTGLKFTQYRAVHSPSERKSVQGIKNIQYHYMYLIPLSSLLAQQMSIL